MSRQNKAAKKQVLAKQFTELRKRGEKGPSRTEPKHGKRASHRIYNQDNPVFKRSRRAANDDQAKQTA